VLHIYDALFQQDKVKHILVRHETGGGSCCGRLRAFFGESGRGIGYFRAGDHQCGDGIATAYMDSIPLVIISGQVPSYAIGEDAFQEVDAVGITRPASNTIF